MKRSKEAVSQSILALLVLFVLSKGADEPKLIILYYVSCKGWGSNHYVGEYRTVRLVFI